MRFVSTADYLRNERREPKLSVLLESGTVHVPCAPPVDSPISTISNSKPADQGLVALVPGGNGSRERQRIDGRAVLAAEDLTVSIRRPLGAIQFRLRRPAPGNAGRAAGHRERAYRRGTDKGGK